MFKRLNGKLEGNASRIHFQLLTGLPHYPMFSFKIPVGFESPQTWMFPKIGGKPPKWMVKIMENPMNKWMIWGYHYFWKHPYYILYIILVGVCFEDLSAQKLPKFVDMFLIRGSYES